MSIDRARVLTPWIAVALVAGCAAVGKLDTNPAKAVDLTGSWTLDRDASDDPKPVIEKLRPKPGSNRRMQPDDAMADDSGPGPVGGSQGGQRGSRRRGAAQQMQNDAYRNNNEAYTHSKVLTTLTADIARADQLTVLQTPERFSLDYGSAIRNFTPGSRSVVSADWGVADQSAGWKGKEFVIEFKPQMGVAAVEKYGLSDDGKHLVEELHLGGGEFPAVKLKRVYSRSDKPVFRGAPTND